MYFLRLFLIFSDDPLFPRRHGKRNEEKYGSAAAQHQPRRVACDGWSFAHISRNRDCADSVFPVVRRQISPPDSDTFYPVLAIVEFVCRLRRIARQLSYFLTPPAVFVEGGIAYGLVYTVGTGLRRTAHNMIHRGSAPVSYTHLTLPTIYSV